MKKTGGDRPSAPPALIICYYSISNVISESYFFSMVFSNMNPEAINVAKINTIVVFIFLPFLFFKLNIALLPLGMRRFLKTL